MKTAAAAGDQLILLGADSPIGLSVIRELGERGVRLHCIGASQRSVGLYSRHAATRNLRARSEDAVVEQINCIGAQTGCRWVMTIGEGDILLLQRNRKRLDGIAAILPDPEAFARVLDKGLTYARARTLGIRTPKCWSPASVEAVEGLRDTLRFPLVLKWGNPSRMAKRLKDLGLRLDKYRYIHSFDELSDYLKPLAGLGELPLLQEYCPGYGLGQMFFFDRGEPLLRFQHRREAEWPPEGGVSAVCRSLPASAHGELMERSVALLRELNWRGPAMVEYRYDPSADRACLMEINGRFWGSMPLAYHAGAPFAWLWYCATTGREPGEIGAYREGIRCRYFAPEIKRLKRILIEPGEIQDRTLRFHRWRELIGFLAAYLNPRTRYYLFSWRDPGPFFADAWGILKGILKR